VVEHLTSKLKALSSNSSITKEKEGRKEGRRKEEKGEEGRRREERRKASTSWNQLTCQIHVSWLVLTPLTRHPLWYLYSHLGSLGHPS
jgi:hypothetical protein